ncbi:MAG: hypothetical protein HKN87_21880, partial [Saprospiraceae bacterium]|nr:hypothetical protein [Saprospiraceae bacterium]
MKKTSFTSSDYSCWIREGLWRYKSPFKYIQVALLVCLGAFAVQAQIGPNCTHINASIGVNDSASILVSELVTNIASIAAQGDSV